MGAWRNDLGKKERRYFTANPPPRRRRHRYYGVLAPSAPLRAAGHRTPPRLTPARGPPLWQMPDAGQDEYKPQARPAPDYEFNQRIAWQAPRQDEPPSLFIGRLVPGATSPANYGQSCDSRQ